MREACEDQLLGAEVKSLLDRIMDFRQRQSADRDSALAEIEKKYLAELTALQEECEHTYRTPVRTIFGEVVSSNCNLCRKALAKE